MPEHLQPVLCTAAAVVEGGRLEVDLSVPESMGGSGGPGTNPEELFAVGDAVCFQSALLPVATGRKLGVLQPTRAMLAFGVIPADGST